MNSEQADWTPKCGYPCDDDGCVESCERDDGHPGEHKCGDWITNLMVEAAEEER